VGGGPANSSLSKAAVEVVSPAGCVIIYRDLLQSLLRLEIGPPHSLQIWSGIVR